MIRHSAPPSFGAAASAAILLNVARRWRWARDGGSEASLPLSMIKGTKIRAIDFICPTGRGWNLEPNWASRLDATQGLSVAFRRNSTAIQDSLGHLRQAQIEDHRHYEEAVIDRR